VALIDLEEGHRMLSNIVGEASTNIQVGDSVEVVWSHRSDHSVPQFRPSGRG
jgi:uncharacterized OB-fold protein